MAEFRRILQETLAGAGLDADAALLDCLALHWRLVREANRRFNLTAITDNAEAAHKHYLDCLLALPLIGELLPAADGCRAADIGSGGGFPGLVLAAARPELNWTLLEATEKKAAFLAQAAREMGLQRVTVRALRAEDAGRDAVLRAGFHLATARAVAPLAVLAEYALPLLAPGGFLLAYKGLEAKAELAQAVNALKLLGGSPRAGGGVHSLPYGERRLCVVEKTRATPDKYPRRAGMPAKHPL